MNEDKQKISNVNSSENEVEILKEISLKLDGIKKHPPLWRYLVQGMLVGLGSVIGATVIIAIIVALLKTFVSVPVIGEIITQIIALLDKIQSTI
jgi:hypothetical protein